MAAFLVYLGWQVVYQMSAKWLEIVGAENFCRLGIVPRKSKHCCYAESPARKK